MRAVGCVVVLILLAQGAWALPYENKGDFLGSIHEFVYHTTGSLVSSLLDWWDNWLYGEYNLLLEQDLSAINPEPVNIALPDGQLNTESREALAHLASSQEAMRNAKAKQAECKLMKQKYDECSFFCIPEYHVKLCAKDFFNEIETAQAELDNSLSKTLEQISTDYEAYKHYGIGKTQATILDGCYLYVLDIYNAIEKNGTIAPVRGEDRPGDKIQQVREAASKDIQYFFNTLAANQDALIPKMLEKHTECRGIEKKVLEEHNGKILTFSAELSRLETSYVPVEEQKMCLLEAEDLEAIEPTNTGTLASTVDLKRKDKLLGKDPKAACRLIEGNLKELRAAKTDALVDTSTGDGYLVKSLEAMDEAESLIRQADENLLELSTTLTGIKEKAQKRAQALRIQAEQLRPGLEPEVLAQYKKDMQEAEQAIAQAEAKGTDGEAAKTLAGAIMKLQAMLGAYSESPEEDVSAAVDEAESRIYLAEADKLEMSTEKAILASAKEALKRNDLQLAKLKARKIIAAIDEKARERYFALPDARQTAKDNLNYLPAQEQTKFLKYEKYYTPNLDYSAALGDLFEMENAYAAALAMEEQIVNDTAKGLLEKGIKAKIRYADPLIAGEPAQVIAEYSFTNPTGFTIPATQASVALGPNPIGAITTQNIIGSSYLESTAYSSDKLILSTKSLPEGASFSITLSYFTLPADLTSLKRQVTAGLSDAEFKYTASFSISGSPERILLPLDENIQSLSNNYPDDFQEIEGRQYLAAWYPKGNLERSFRIPSPVTMQRKNTQTTLMDKKAKIKETVHLENNEAYGIDSLEFKIDINTPATDVSGAEYSSGRLKIKTALGPHAQKDLQISYTVSDSTFYCLAYQEQAKAELEKENITNKYPLNSDLEQAAGECDSGDIETAISLIDGVSSSISSLREISRGNTQEKETYERLETQAQERIGQAEAENQASSTLGIARADTYQAKEKLSKAKELYSKGNVKQAITEARSVLSMLAEPTGIAKSLEAKKLSLKQKVSGLMATKAALDKLGFKDQILAGTIDQAGASQTRFELALISGNRTKAIYALLDYEVAYSSASRQMTLTLEAHQGQIDSHLEALQENMTGMIQTLSLANYSTPLGLHVPYSFEQWAKQQGMASRDQEYEKAKEKHIANLTASLAQLESLKLKPAEEKLTIFQASLGMFSTSQAQAFLSKAGSEVESKRKNADTILALAEESSAKGTLTNEAIKLVSDAKQYNSQGRYLDSIAYTGFAIATGTKPPDSTPKLAAISLVLLIGTGLVYTKKDKLKKYIDKKEESIDLAERGLSFRKAKEY